MSVREHPIKPGYYIIDCRPDGYKGKRQRLDFKGTKEEALAWEKTVMRRHADSPAVSPRMMSAIFPAWMAYYRANRAKSTAEDAENCWRHLKESFGRLQPKALTRALIEQYKTLRIKDGVKHRTVNKELSYLSSMLKWAADNDLCDPLPFAIPLYPKRMTSAPKPRPLSPDQVTMLYNAIDPEYRLVLLLMADAGLRRDEALRLTRDQVEIENGLIFVTGKGSKERIIPITTDRLLLEIERKRDVKGWLTVNPETGRPYLTIRKALMRAATKAGIEKHLYHHLLRHSFGTNATVAGYDLSALQSIMGHSSPMTTGIYQHLAGDYLRTQGRKLNALTGQCPHGVPVSRKEDTENKG